MQKTQKGDFFKKREKQKKKEEEEEKGVQIHVQNEKNKE